MSDDEDSLSSNYSTSSSELGSRGELVPYEGGGENAAGDGGEIVPLEGRVDASLLEEVKSYEAVPILDTVNYGGASFWDDRYTRSKGEPFEWYHPWKNVAPSLAQYMGEEDEILVCGCGSSPLSVDMYDEGFSQVTNVDLSRVVIDIMSEKFGPDEFPGMKWVAMDLTMTNFKDDTFDVALDKACLDAMLCSMDGSRKARKYVREMNRILRDDGAFVCISSGDPRDRLAVLELWDVDNLEESLPWDVQVDAVPKPTVKARDAPDLCDPEQLYFIYICIKDPRKVNQRLRAMDKARMEQAKKLAKITGGRPPKR